MAFTASSVIVASASLATRNRDQLSFPYNAVPQAMTVYVRFIHLGEPDATRRILQIGAASGASPRFLIYLSSASQLRVAYGANDIANTNTLTYGDRVETRAFLTVAG